MDEHMRTEQLRNLAAAMILGASELTDELTDSEARSVLDQALLQAEAAVDELTSSPDTAEMPPEDAREMIAERIAPVRRFMREINALVGKRRSLTAEELLQELHSLRTMAEELPLPPAAPVSSGSLSLLAHWPMGPENLGFVLAILHVFEPSPTARSGIRGESAELDTRDDTRRAKNSED